MHNRVKIMRLIIVGSVLSIGLAGCTTSLSEGYPELHDLKRVESDNISPEQKEAQIKELQKQKDAHKQDTIKEIKTNQ